MLQISQDYRTGQVRVVDVPSPVLRPGGVLVRTVTSLISAGTERGKVELARKSMLAKVRERPDAVRKVVDVVRSEGPAAAFRRARHRLEQLTPLGYSAAGTVIDCGEGVTRFRKGDRVAVGGGGYANHAEIVWVPQNLAAPVPEGVNLDEAAFATVASIALHAIRLAQPALGDTVAVIGLGLIGQLAARLATAAGCRVVACDPQEARVALAADSCASSGPPETLAARVGAVSQGIGADVVLVTAASASSDPIRLAAHVCRERGVVVAVGAVGMDVPREEFYRKELRLVVSRSYGPGRYDPTYEEHGVDYPVSYVRWTEGRNLEAVLQLMADGRLEVESLISRRFPIADAPQAYELLLEVDPGIIGIMLDYPVAAEPDRPLRIEHTAPPVPRATRETVGIGLIGAGSFASNVLIPAIKQADARLVTVSSASGLSAQDAVRRHGFIRAVPTAEDVIADAEVDAVVIATPHHLHAHLTLEAARAGKAVLVEKPLAITTAELELLVAELPSDAAILVGYNRRFSPHVSALQNLLKTRAGALMVGVRVNAGAIAKDSWIHDPAVGGGRLAGEGCHFVDLAAGLVGRPPHFVQANAVGARDASANLMDNFVITVEYEDGSLATILYTSKGDRRLGKERIEVFADGCSAVIDNFDRTIIYRDGRRTVTRARGAKGHREEVQAFVEAVRSGGPMPVSLSALLTSTAATLLARESILRGGARLPVTLRPA